MSYNILVVEDDGLVLRAIERILKRNDYRVFCASSGEGGLVIFQKNSIDLVVTDVTLGGLNGMEMVTKMCEKNPEMPVIFISARSHVAAEALNKVKNGFFLKKPCSAYDIDEAVLKAVASIEIRQQLNNRTRQSIQATKELKPDIYSCLWLKPGKPGV